MCGIAGIIQYNDEPLAPYLVEDMGKAISHRGPDDRGVFSWSKNNWHGRFSDWDEKEFLSAALISSRLAIQDLTPAGRMPMSSIDKTVWVIQNGEVYNFVELRQELQGRGVQFFTRTDTEVIIQAYLVWGFEEFLRKANGDFAIVLIDLTKRKIFFGRDRFGVKPLFYQMSDGVLRFASEVKAIVQDSRVNLKPDDRMVFSYLSNMFPDPSLGGKTFFEGINQAPTGSYAVISLEKAPQEIKFTRYWQPDISHKKQMSDGESVERFKYHFLRAVKLRMRGDVPLGVFLSGGLDSSSILGAVDFLRSSQENNEFNFLSDKYPLRTISAVFPGEEQDESRYINQVLAGKQGIESTFISFNYKNITEHLYGLQYFQEEPLGPMNVLLQGQLYEEAARLGLKVVFDGLGGDELFGGYQVYRQAYLADVLKSGGLIQLLKEAGNFNSSGKSEKLVERSVIQAMPFGLRRFMRDMDCGRRFNFINPELRGQCRKWYQADQRLDREISPECANSGYLDRFLYLSLTDSWMNNSVPLSSRYSDRNGMANGVEPRVPFLDHELVELVFSMDNGMKFHNGWDRLIQRRALKGLVPAEVLNRRDKVGFSVPAENWMRLFFAEPMKQLLNEKRLNEYEYINMPLCRKLFDSFIEGKRPYNRLFWQWFCLLLWLNVCIDGGFKNGCAEYAVSR